MAHLARVQQALAALEAASTFATSRKPQLLRAWYLPVRDRCMHGGGTATHRHAFSIGGSW